jgi:UDP-glucose 4,6-dehydratase
MRLLITGGAGFIGSHIVDSFIGNDNVESIMVLDKMTYAADFRNLMHHAANKKFELKVGDIVNYDTCRDAMRNIDVVIHAAAESHVDKSFDNSPIFSLTNTYGTHNLLEAFRHSSAERFLHVSTDEVYGESGDHPHTEGDILNPTNPYAASKAAAEMIVNSYMHSYNSPITIIRANNIYGIRQYPEKLIPKTILNFLTGRAARVHGDGQSRRSFLSAADLSRAIHTLLADNGSIQQIYNIASAHEFSVLEIVRHIAMEMNVQESNIFEFEADRPFNDRRYLINSQKIYKTGWRQQDSVLSDLAHLVKWYSDNISRYGEIFELS